MLRPSETSGSALYNIPQLLENYIAGSRGNEGQLSPVRRFFCLFVTFDFLFTGLLWLICLVISNHTLWTAIQHQILEYSIYSSIFDVVMLSGARLVLLLLAYGLFHFNHWIVVAFTTVSSCAFLVTKVFYYNWETVDTNSTFSVLLLLCSFVLAWSEVWLLDFRVIPREKQAMDVEALLHHNEHTPLLRHFAPSVDERSAFYSPMATPPESDDEEDLASSIENEGYERKAKEALTIALGFINSDDWEIELTSGSDIVYSKKSFGNKKMYKFVGTVEASADFVFNELYVKVEQGPLWNKSVTDSRILQVINDSVDIVYQVAAESAGGVVASRDFVNLRTWEKRNDVFVSAGISVVHKKMPPQKSYVRGENGPSAFVIENIPDESHLCQFTWLLNTELKGWIPQYLIDQALAKVMLDFVKYLRNHISSINT
ncbi:hypothetical protein CHUAL_000958 [Chamberlinius hualienensis]